MNTRIWLCLALLVCALPACASKLPAPAAQNELTPTIEPEAQTVSASPPSDSAADSQVAPSAEPQKTQVQETQDDSALDDPQLVRCEAKVLEFDLQSIGIAPGPSLEEARDGAILYACRNLCTDKNAAIEETMDDDRIEKILDNCAEECGESAVVVGVSCSQFGEEIYTEGEWSPTHDEAPTNGAEDL